LGGRLREKRGKGDKTDGWVSANDQVGEVRESRKRRREEKRGRNGLKGREREGKAARV